MLGATFDDDATLAILSAAGFSTIQGVQYFTNGLDTRAQGVDVAGNLRVPAGSGGTLDLTASFNVTRNDDPERRSTAPGADGCGIHRAGAARLGDRDRHRGRAAGLARNAPGQLQRPAGFSALGRLSYFGGFSSAQPGFCDLCRENYGGKGLVDAEAGLSVQSGQARLGVRNLFDTYPDQPSSPVVVDDDGSTSKDFNDNFGTFPWAAASPFGYNGRYVYARTEIQLFSSGLPA